MTNLKSSIKKKLLLLKHSGSKLECPICGYQAKNFLSGGLHTKRKNAKCPKCGSVERQRILWKYISEKSELKDKPHLNILHFAPEESLAKKLKQYFKNYKTSDFGTNKSDFNFDLMAVNCQDNTWDCVICFHVLEHVENDIRGMKEIYRILKQGGQAFIQIPIWPSESHPTYENPLITDSRDRKINYGQEDHLRIYGLDVADRLKSAGFNVSPIRYKEVFSSEEINRFGLENSSGISEVFFICEK